MSTVGENEFCFTWKIEVLSFWWRRGLTSPEFEAQSLGNNKWYLWTDFDETADPIHPAVSLFCCLLRCYTNSEKINIDYKIDFIDPKGNTLKSVGNKNELFHTSCMSSSRLKINVESFDWKQWREDEITTRCIMKNADPKKNLKGGGSEVQTKICLDRCTFSLTSRKQDKVLKEFFNLGKGNYVLEMLRLGDLDDLSVKIREIGDLVYSTRIFCNMIFLDSQIDTISERDSHLFDDYKCPSEDRKAWEFPLKKDKLRNIYRKCDDITVRFEFAVPNGCFSHKLLTNNFQRIVNLQICDLQNDMRNLFINKKHADVELRSGRAVFPVHKSILVARSPVFDAMFDQNMIDYQTGVVDILDVDETTLKVFLQYLYTGSMNEAIDYECAKKLLLVSDKYQVLSMRKECSLCIMNALSVKNVCEVLTIADMIKEETLKKSALDYITSHAEEILLQPEWSEWTENNSRLVSTILTEMLLHSKLNFKEV